LCPADQTALKAAEDALSCAMCGRRYPIQDGVVRFNSADTFYEGAYDNQVRYLPRSESFLHNLPLWLIRNSFLWRVRKYIRRSSRVVELGCAGGVAWFGKQYFMAGIEVSRHALIIAAGKYSVCLQADNLRSIPSSSIDAVISSYFWEHIAPEAKPALLDEIFRVLKPGGRVVFLYDVATANPLISWLRQISPELYRAEFIDKDGHLGYQTVDDNDALFEAHGFRILCSHPMERTPLQSGSTYLKMQKWPGVPGFLGRALTFVDRHPFYYAYVALLRVIDETVGRFLPPSWGRITVTVAAKE
jgi:SAM-dependent methyltransferase